MNKLAFVGFETKQKDSESCFELERSYFLAGCQETSGALNGILLRLQRKSKVRAS